MNPVTQRQLVVLRFIHAFRRQNDFAPTQREIAAAVGICSTNGVKDHLERLERKGLLRRAPLRARALSLTAAGLQLAAAEEPQEGAP